MTTLNIRTHNNRNTYTGHYFFILNKGMNCGKPLKVSCPNCFVLQFRTEAEAENYYWLAYSLWASKYWHRFLIGSVIPYFRIGGFASEFEARSRKMFLEFEQHKKQVRTLQLLELHETQHKSNIVLIKQMRNVVLSWYYK